MDRRRFLAGLALTPLLARCGRDLQTSGHFSENEVKDCQSFGYYQGLLPTQKRDPGRTDGTYSKMPCISKGEIEKAVEQTYDFWHGHGQRHQFTITAEDFVELQKGKSIEVYTTVVDGHRHAVRIDSSDQCRR